MASEDMELTSQVSYVGMSQTAASPATKSRVADLDDDVGRLFDLRDRSLLNLNLERPLENDCLHGVFAHGVGVGRTTVMLCGELSVVLRILSKLLRNEKRRAAAEMLGSYIIRPLHSAPQQPRLLQLRRSRAIVRGEKPSVSVAGFRIGEPRCHHAVTLVPDGRKL